MLAVVAAVVRLVVAAVRYAGVAAGRRGCALCLVVDFVCGSLALGSRLRLTGIVAVRLASLLGVVAGSCALRRDRFGNREIVVGVGVR